MTADQDRPDSTGQAVTDGETPVEALVEGGVSVEAPIGGSTCAGAQARARIAHFLRSRPRLTRAWDVAVGDRPSVWSTSPATPAEVCRYAAAGEWCAEESRYLRWAGQAYCLGVAIPFTVAAYMAAWLLQRPARGAAVLVLVVVIRLFG